MCERVKTGGRHRVPIQGGEGCGADAAQEKKIHMHSKLSNYCQMHEYLFINRVSDYLI